MKKVLSIAVLIGASVSSLFAQEVPKNDPGFSVNNYKHPNKAKAAQKAKTEGTSVEVTTFKGLEGQLVDANYHHPKYAPRPKLLVAESETIDKEHNNPLNSSRNYKLAYVKSKKGEIQKNADSLALNTDKAE